MSSGFASDPHTEAGSDCPKNYFGIPSYEQLQNVERSFGIRRAAQLEDRDITGCFDSSHLKAIHKFLFQDVFPWAGEFRVVNIYKGESPFAQPFHIQSALTEVLSKLPLERSLRDLSTQGFARRAAFYLGEINAIHPFREGNGRTQREFIRQLAVQAGHPLSWQGFTQRQMVDASVASHLRGNYDLLAAIIEASLASSRGRTPKS